MNGNVLLGDDLNEKKYNEDLYQTIVNHFEKHKDISQNQKVLKIFYDEFKASTIEELARNVTLCSIDSINLFIKCYKKIIETEIKEINEIWKFLHQITQEILLYLIAIVDKDKEIISISNSKFSRILAEISHAKVFERKPEFILENEILKGVKCLSNTSNYLETNGLAGFNESNNNKDLKNTIITDALFSDALIKDIGLKGDLENISELLTTRFERGEGHYITGTFNYSIDNLTKFLKDNKFKISLIPFNSNKNKTIICNCESKKFAVLFDFYSLKPSTTHLKKSSI